MDRIERADVIVVGAGPAGLATAHELVRAGRTVLVLEQGESVATTWRRHRSGLRLHTVRGLSGLPGLRIPARVGRYPSSSDLVRYLEAYADRAELDVRTRVAVSRVRRSGSGDRTPGWTVSTSVGVRFRAETVVIATGYNRVPYIPALPGLETFRGRHLHVTDYRGGTQFSGKDVLVIGAGNAAAEAATAMVAGGVGRVRMAVRTPPHIVRRRIWGVSTQRIAILLGFVPTRLADRVAARISALTIPDLSGKRLERPRPDLYTRVLRDRSVPVHDTGIVELLESGRVAPVPAAVEFSSLALRLSDGSTVAPDVVVFATGYRRGLQQLLEGVDVLDASGDPRSRSGGPAAEGLYFVGFTVTATGALRQLGFDARRVVRAESRRRRRS